MTEEQAKSRFAAEIRGFELLAEYFSRWEPGFKILYTDDGFFGYDTLHGEKCDGHYFSKGVMNVRMGDRIGAVLWQWFRLDTSAVHNTSLVLLHVTDEILECFVLMHKSEETVEGWVEAHYYSKVLCAGDDWKVDSAHYVHMWKYAVEARVWELVSGDYRGESSYSLELLKQSYTNIIGWPEKVLQDYKAVREKMSCLS